MQATFVELPPFERTRKDYMDDEAYRLLQLELMANPKAGAVIEGTEGLRKLRRPTRVAVKESAVVCGSSITGGQVAISFGFLLSMTKTKRMT